MGKEKVKKTIFEKILSIFAWCVFVIAILTALLAVWASFSSDKNGKEIFGVKFLIVASDSMSKSPISENEEIFFDAGDVVIIKTTKDNTSFKVGDVITFISYNPDSYGKTLTHKIREINYSKSGKLIGYTTYGINTGESDRVLVSPDTIIGQYSGKIPKLGTMFSYLKTPAGYYLSILTPSVLLIIFFSINVGKFFGRKEALAEQAETNTSQEVKDLQDRVATLEEQIKVAMQTASQAQAETATTQSAQQTDDNVARRITFAQRVLGLDQTIQQFFSDIHNEFLSYDNVSDRLSNKCMSYRVGKKLLAKISVRGKTMKLHLALDVNAFSQSVYHQKDLSAVKAYAEVPFTVKVKSERGRKNAIKLIEALMSKNALTKKEGFVYVDIISFFAKDNQINPSVEQAQEVVATEEQATERTNRMTFAQRLLSLDQSVQQFFDNLHNQLCSYKKVHDRLSNKCMSYRVGRKLIAKISARGKTMKLHLALDVNAFSQSVYHQKDMSAVKAYAEVPFTVKVKSARGEKNAIKLIEALMEQNQIAKNDKYEKTDALSLLANQAQRDEQSLAVEQTPAAQEVPEESATGLVILGNKISFVEKLLGLDSAVQEYFNTLHNKLCSYKKVHDRTSFKGASYRLGRKLIAKITVRGKTMKLHLALDVNAFSQSVYHQKDLSAVKAYAEVPFTVKVKSERGRKNAIKLIEALMSQNEVLQNQRYNQVNQIEIFKEK